MRLHDILSLALLALAPERLLRERSKWNDPTGLAREAEQQTELRTSQREPLATQSRELPVGVDSDVADLAERL